MDLFIINRYKDEDETAVLDQESKNLQKLKQRIEERKKLFQEQKKLKTVTEITLKQPPKENPEEDVTPVDDSVENKRIPEVTEKLTETKIEKQKKNKEKTSSEFKVLGINEFEKKIKVKRVLPHWLSHPIIISTGLRNLTCQIELLPWLHQTLKDTLLSEKVTQLFPVQEKVIPFVLNAHRLPNPLWPNDVCVSAPTGSGKTLAFVLPIIQVLINSVGRHVRALVVLPVQELAIQVAKVFRKYCTKTGLKVALLSGSTPLRHEQQQIVRFTESNGWVSEVDIIVSTAGRLVEHLKTTTGFSLKHLKFLVIDEADRIMDHIQNDWLYHLDKHIKLDNELMTGKVPSLSWNNLTTQNRPPHKLLFSATLSQDPEKLEQWGLFQPKLFSASQETFSDDENDVIRKYTTPDELKEKCIVCEAEQKPMILYYLLTQQKWDKVLCFTNASQSAHRLAALLNNMGGGVLKVAEISASLDRSTREMVLKKFHSGEISVLVSTDALARGIDVPNCDYVISYDLPKNIKTYIHRVGRTGRAGREGCGVTMVLQNQVTLFKELLHSGGKTELPKIDIPENISETFAENYENAIEDTKNMIQDEVQAKVKKSIALKRSAKNNRKRKPGFNNKHVNAKKSKNA